MRHVIQVPSLRPEGYPYASYQRIFDTDRMAMSLVTVRPGAAVPEHEHVDEEQVYYVLRGRGVVALGDTRHPVGTGSAVYIPLGTRHGVTNESQTEPFEYLYVVAFLRPEKEGSTG